MRAFPVETRQAARKMYREKVSITEISEKLNVCDNTVRNWIFQDNRSKRDLYRKWFKEMCLQPGFTYAMFERETGIGRATSMKWRKEFFPDVPTMSGVKWELFCKLVEKKDLSINEKALLLGTTRTSVLRFKNQYEAYKTQGNATTAAAKRKAKSEKYNQLELNVKWK